MTASFAVGAGAGFEDAAGVLGGTPETPEEADEALDAAECDGDLAAGGDAIEEEADRSALAEAGCDAGWLEAEDGAAVAPASDDDSAEGGANEA